MAFEQKGRRWLGRKPPGGDEGTSVKEHTTQTLRQGGVREHLPSSPMILRMPRARLGVAWNHPRPLFLTTYPALPATGDPRRTACGGKGFPAH